MHGPSSLFRVVVIPCRVPAIIASVRSGEVMKDYMRHL